MRAVDLIACKRDGAALSREQIDWLIGGYVRQEIPDYQMAAWAMAVQLRGMDLRETTDLTLAMAHSGTTLDLSDIAPVVADKHSTGGVGDKTTLLLTPLVAAIGLPVGKMSGRALGFSGGTIDKLESIPGFRAELSVAEFRQVLRDVGLVVAAQSSDLAPADKLLYALRDVTATVPSIPLIAASVMSKKLAAGATCIALDVKYGSGAFMRTLDEARTLAQTLVAIGQRAGRRTVAVLSSMEQPLGYAVGNALEVREAIAALRGNGSPDLVELCLELGAQLAVLADAAPTAAAARADLQAALTSGAAWQKFRQMIARQGGDLAAIDEPERLPQAAVVVPVLAPRSGYVSAIDGEVLGSVLNAAGSGRSAKDGPVDPAVGVVLRAKVGDQVWAGKPLCLLHVPSAAAGEQAAQALLRAYTFSAAPVPVPPLIAEVVTAESSALTAEE